MTVTTHAGHTGTLATPAEVGAKYIRLLVMAAGSIVGTFIGGKLLGVVPNGLLLPLLAAILVISAIKVWGHK